MLVCVNQYQSVFISVNQALTGQAAELDKAVQTSSFQQEEQRRKFEAGAGLQAGQMPGSTCYTFKPAKFYL